MTTNWPAEERLALFLHRAAELEQSSLIESQYTHSLSMKYDRVRGSWIEMTNPDEDQLKSFLMTFRQFVSVGEPVHLATVYNLLIRHVTSDEIKGHLIEARDAWKRDVKIGDYKLNYNAKDISPEYIADLWINGWYFHSDYEKRRKIESLLPFAIDYSIIRDMFICYILNTTAQILYVAFMIRVVTKDGLISFNP